MIKCVKFYKIQEFSMSYKSTSTDESNLTKYKKKIIKSCSKSKNIVIAIYTPFFMLKTFHYFVTLILF